MSSLNWKCINFCILALLIDQKKTSDSRAPLIRFDGQNGSPFQQHSLANDWHKACGRSDEHDHLLVESIIFE